MIFDIEETAIAGLKILTPRRFSDERGYFVEVFNEKDLQAVGLNLHFVQDNDFVSKAGVLRGLHYQKRPQGKLVRVSAGAIFDVAVDMRKESPTYRCWEGVVLTSENRKELYIPEGFAHGYYVLSDNTVVNIKLSGYWDAEEEVGIPWNDPMLAINWPLIREPIIADKDKNYSPLEVKR